MCSVLTASSLSAKTKKSSPSGLLFLASSPALPQREGAAMRMDFPEILEIPEVP